MPNHRVIIIGGGFGGLRAAQALASASVEVLLVDRRNFHLFQPLLYQVATGGLSPANISAPLRGIVKHQRNTRVVLGEVSSIDVKAKTISVDGEPFSYDSLILAAGSSHSYFGQADWEPLAPGLKTIEDATEIRRRILSAFEIAEREKDPQRVKALLSFVIIGAGPTGVEMAGAICELARHTLRYDFRHIQPEQAQCMLLEGGERILQAMPPDLSEKASRSLERLGCAVRTHCRVVDLKPGLVTVSMGGVTEQIAAETVIWAAGVQASPLGKRVAEQVGAPLDKGGRIITAVDLSVPGAPDVFVIGDMASYTHDPKYQGKPLPGLAPVAMQQGRYVAKLIGKYRCRGVAAPPQPFRYWHKGSMATIGRAAAVADLGFARFNGMLAWLAWLFIHLMYLVEYSDRLLVLLQWFWHYLTWNQSARLITGEAAKVRSRQEPG